MEPNQASPLSRIAVESGSAYVDLLTTLAASHPRMADKLVEAQLNRGERLEFLLGGPRLRGVDQLLRYLDGVASACEADPALVEISFLIRRISSDVETAVEAILSGYISVAGDAMRDLMEIELLLFDFSLDRNRLRAWLDRGQRRGSDFQPAGIRERLHHAGVDPYRNLSKDLDYEAHNEALHVSPTNHPLFAKGIQDTDEGLLQDAGFWELFEHARRVLVAIDALRDSLASRPWPEVSGTDDLLLFHEAWARTQQMQDMYLAFLTVPEELRRDLGREPAESEILSRVADRLKRRRFRPRLPFAGAGPIRRLRTRLWRSPAK